MAIFNLDSMVNDSHLSEGNAPDTINGLEKGTLFCPLSSHLKRGTIKYTPISSQDQYLIGTFQGISIDDAAQKVIEHQGNNDINTSGDGERVRNHYMHLLDKDHLIDIPYLNEIKPDLPDDVNYEISRQVENDSIDIFIKIIDLLGYSPSGGPKIQ